MQPRTMRAAPARSASSAKVDTRLALAVGITVLFWASAFAGIRAGLKAYTPEHVALLRYLTASIVLAIYAVITKMPLPKREHLPGILVLGGIGLAFYNFMLNIGEMGVSAGVASLIVASAPVFVALFARLFLKEQLTRWAWVGIAVCFSGVTIIALGANSDWRLSLSALLVLAAAVAQGVYSVGQKPFLRSYSPVQFTTYAIWSGTAFLGSHAEVVLRPSFA